MLYFKFDYKGFIYFTISLFALLLAIAEGHTWGWHSLKIIALGLITLVFGVLFYIRDHHINYPLIDFSLFKIKTFTYGNLGVMTSYMAMYTNSILLPFFLQEILKYNALVTGLLILPYSVTLSVVAPFAGRLSGKYGSRYLTLAGPVVYCIALLMFTLYDKNCRKRTFPITFKQCDYDKCYPSGSRACVRNSCAFKKYGQHPRRCGYNHFV